MVVWRSCLLAVLFFWGVIIAGSALARQGEDLAWGVALDGYPVTQKKLTTIKNETNLPPRLVVFFMQWPEDPRKGFFPKESLEAIHKAGALAVITWEPMYIDSKSNEQPVLAEQILRGEYDPYLMMFAKGAVDFGKPVIIRFGHEMNLSRYHWGTGAKDYGPESPGIYKQIYRYVVSKIRACGAKNVLWAFCPNAESLPHPRWHGAKWNTAGAYYPGHGYVDILGMDGYNWGTTRNKKEHGWESHWLAFASIFKELNTELRALAPDKPLIVFETGCAQKGGDRNAWLRQGLAKCRQWEVKALIWFQTDKEVDWRLLVEKDDESLKELEKACGDQSLQGLLSQVSERLGR
ncbi:glycoside hydrolase family 26 protein [Dethiosulfatarculus sandiegensis]|uniref:Endoglucanase n=1 Tax=Dethiosulfatarculus sandiegensis TaxID=1429043 RepID=A0A0D2J578_9BACT|nr:glycosyl hydrolase [Dethiosulfatarculus sandiegensis]KIX10861.1 endoglucanase [Dethiosulfatarculus sandiegensis]